MIWIICSRRHRSEADEDSELSRPSGRGTSIRCPGHGAAAARGGQRGRGPFGLLGHFQRCEAMRKENALIGYAFCKKARARSGRSLGDSAAVVSVSRGGEPMKENRRPGSPCPCAPGGILPKSHRAHKGGRAVTPPVIPYFIVRGCTFRNRYQPFRRNPLPAYRPLLSRKSGWF